MAITSKPSIIFGVFPRNCDQSTKTLPHAISSRPDDKVVIRGALPIQSFCHIVTITLF